MARFQTAAPFDSSPFSGPDIEGRYYLTGFLFSFLGHGFLFYAMLFLLAPGLGDFGPPIIYSVTLEGGKSLGGISQAPLSEKKEAVVPPKAVSAPEQPSSDVSAIKPTQEEASVKDAEVSLADKAKIEEEKRRKEAEEKQRKAAEEKKRKDAEEKKKKEAEEKAKKKQPTAAEIEKQYQQAMQRYLGESAAAGGKGFGAATLGGSGMGGGTLVSPEELRYMRLLTSHVKRGWKWFDLRSTLHAVVEFQIALDGAVSDVKIVASSGNGQFDESVRRAVLKASPVPPPPEKYYESRFRIVQVDFSPTE